MPARPNLGRRIIVTGTSGSGKTVLANELSSLLDRRLIEMDAILMDDRARQKPPEEVSAALNDVAWEGEWILEGRPFEIPQLAWNNATAVIWLHLPRAVRAWRLFKRGFPRWLMRQRMWGGIRYALIAPAAEAYRWRRFVEDNTPETAVLITSSTRIGTRDLTHVMRSR